MKGIHDHVGVLRDVRVEPSAVERREGMDSERAHLGIEIEHSHPRARAALVAAERSNQRIVLPSKRVERIALPKATAALLALFRQVENSLGGGLLGERARGHEGAHAEVRVRRGEPVARREGLGVEHAGVDEQDVEGEAGAIGDVTERAPRALHARENRGARAEGLVREAEHLRRRGAFEARVERGEQLASDSDHRARAYAMAARHAAAASRHPRPPCHRENRGRDSAARPVLVAMR